eukprot:704714-Heterocapsa_arctica.AAC.1
MPSKCLHRPSTAGADEHNQMPSKCPPQDQQKNGRLGHRTGAAVCGTAVTAELAGRSDGGAERARRGES